jgi:hypothetical protein
MTKFLAQSLFCVTNIIALVIFVFLYANFAQAGEATISWIQNTEPDLAGYKIYYGTSTRDVECPPANYPYKVDVGQTTSSTAPTYKLENLADGETWFFSVTSYNASGQESCFSEEMSKVMPARELTAKEKIMNFFNKIINFFKNLF